VNTHLSVLSLAGLLGLMACSTKDAGSTSEDLHEDTSETGTPSDTDPGGSQAQGSAGCGIESPEDLSALTVGTQTRTLVLHLPSDYDPDRPYPLIFAWHGLGGSGELAQYYFGIEQVTGSDAIIAYPNGLPRSDSGGRTGWDLSPYGHDFEFFDAMVTTLTQGLCIDEKRIFSTGHSFGGYMSNALGCYRPEAHSAVAPVAGGPPFFGDCTSPVAVWLTHGTADPTVDYSEGEGALSRWLYANSCDESSTAVEPSPCVAYEGCTRDVHWCAHTGEHEWPLFAGAAIWDFFQAQ
jgi:polyhydroxybutyrate depolymerase